VEYVATMYVMYVIGRFFSNSSLDFFKGKPFLV